VHPGYLGTQDTYYIGTIKSVGRIYQQTFLDTYSKVAFVKLYDRKNALVAADLLTMACCPSLKSTRSDCCARHRSWDGILRATRASRIRTVLGSGQHRPQPGQGPAPAYQRHLRTLPSHHSGRLLRHTFRKNLYTSLEKLQAHLDE
jgi:hypothetical protein